jgi:MFS family permease
VGYLTAILVRPIISLATSAWQVVGFRVVDRVGKGLRSPARDAMIAGLTPVGARGRSFGFHRAADHAGAVAGSLIAWALLQRQAEVRDVIGWSVVPGVVAFLVLAWVLRGVGRSDPAFSGSSAPASATGTPASDAVGRRFWLPVAALPEALLLLFLLDARVAVAVIPLVWAGVHVVRTVAAYPGGLLSDRVGPRTTLRVGSLLYAVLIGWLALQDSALGATGVFLALGLVTGMIEPAERALVAALAPVRTGSGFGTVQAISGVAALPAGLAFGSTYQWLGPGVALFASAGLVAVIALGWRGRPAR